MSTGQYLHQVCVIIRTPRSAALEALDKVQNGDDLHSRMPVGLLLENVEYLYVSIWILLVRGRCITLGNLIPSHASIFTNRVICLMSSSWNHDKWRHPVSRFLTNPNSRHSAINLSVFSLSLICYLLGIHYVAPELVCFCFCICICICSLFPPNVYSALLNATFFTHIWPTFWIYHFYTIISKFFGIKINFSTFMSWSIYFIAFLTIFVPQWEAIFYIFLFFLVYYLS